MNGADGFVVIHLASAERIITRPKGAADDPTAHAEGADFNTGTTEAASKFCSHGFLLDDD
jgi:hypothetical protein